MKRSLVCLLLTAGLVGPAFAQTSAPATGGTVPHTDVGQANGSLSDKLSQTNGVISPKGSVDPAMQKQAPATTGTMPVIRPPGSPGGNDAVQPK